MKKLIPIILLFVFTHSFAQIIVTPTSGELKMFHTADFNRPSTPQNAPYDALTPYVINVYFTLINDGNNQNSLGIELSTPQQAEDKFLECIKILNHKFNASNIFFKYDGYQIVSNDLIANGGWQMTITTFPTYPPNDIAQYKNNNAVNLIFFDFPAENNDTYQYMGYNASFYSISLLNSINNAELTKKLTHKMGHSLSLYHTYETGSHFPPSSPYFELTSCEHVTRSPLDDDYNADIAGDEVADTPAQPIVMDSFFEDGCGAYIYSTQRYNCVPEPYQNMINGNPMNALNYTSTCSLTPFTAGQTRRMREFILNNPSISYNPNYPDHLGVIDGTRTSVNRLFEPYSSTQIVSSTILTSTDNGDGTAKVCRSYNLAEFKFQPGFTYTFLEVPEADATVLSSATSDEYPVIVHQPVFNCPVRIEELSTSSTNLSNNIGQAETVCKGQICVNEPFVSGTDTRTEILGSMNITVEQLNAIRVKDPELYDRLMERYYHILEKYTASGAKTKEVFYKN